jgi:Capsule polysaccharide biosynthesis protein
MNQDFSNTPKFSKKTKCLVVNPLLNYWSIKFTLEAASVLKSMANNVTWINANPSEIEDNEVNATDFLDRKKYGHALVRIEKNLKRKKIGFYNFVIQDSAPMDISEKVRTRADLENLEFKNAKIGKIVAAAISGKVKIYDFSIKENRKLINQYYNEAIILFDYLDKYILDYKPELVVTTNDRILVSGICTLIAQKVDTEIKIIYWGRSSKKYFIYDKSLYFKPSWQNYIREISVERYNSWLEKAYFTFFLSRVRSNGLKSSEKYKQSRKENPIISSKKVFVFFPGTKWENSGLYNDEGNNFLNQEKSVEFLLKTLNPHDWQVIVRHHPLKKNQNVPFESAAWDACRIYENFREILPEENIDSYHLVKNCNIVGIYNSTIGLESIIMGKPTVIFGNPFWKNDSWQNIIYDNDNETHIIQKSLFRVPLYDIYKIWKFLSTYGTKFKYVKGSGTFIIYNFRIIFYSNIILYTYHILRKLVKKYLVEFDRLIER